jgi:hypothetical protein
MEAVREGSGAGSSVKNGAGRRLRWLWLPALLVLSTVLLVAANLLFWVDRTVLDADEFIGTIESVLDQPEVKDRTAQVLAARAAQNPEIQARIDEGLAQQNQNLAFLSPVLNAQIEPLLESVIRRLLDSDLVGTLVDDILRRLYSQVLAILEDQDTVLRIQGNRLILDLNEIIDRLFDRLNLARPERLGGSQERGEVVLLNDSKPLQQAAFFVENRGWIMFGLVAGAVVSLAVVATSQPGGWRRLVLPAGVLVAVGLISLVLVLIAIAVLESVEGERIVLIEMVEALVRNLEHQSILLVIVGALVIAMTDHRARDGLSKGYSAVAERVEAFGAWRLLIIVGAVAALLLYVL